jgi:hypothetical protein
VWLRDRLAGGPVKTDTVLREGEAAGLSRTRLYEAKLALGIKSCTLELDSAWRLP